jgi:glycosyltransferase involved in cell wall biosynthesis
MPMANTPQLTIAIPVYERFDYFEEALKSVLNQTVAVDCIVVDNNSSHDRFKTYVENLNNSRVKYFKNDTNVGMIGNWNKCIEYCQTEWITILHDDDWLHPDFVAEFFEAHKAYPDSGAFAVKVYLSEALKDGYFAKTSGKLHLVKPSTFLFGSLSPYPGVVFKTHVGRDLNGFNANEYPSSDYDFWIRLGQKTPIVKSEKYLAFYRVSQLQGTSTEYINIILKCYEIRKRLLASYNPFYRFLSYYSLFNLYVFYKSSYNTSTDVNDIPNDDIKDMFKRFYNIYRIKPLHKLVNKLIHKVA